MSENRNLIMIIEYPYHTKNGYGNGDIKQFFIVNILIVCISKGNAPSQEGFNLYPDIGLLLL